jgi:hypothetical protein
LASGRIPRLKIAPSVNAQERVGLDEWKAEISIALQNLGILLGWEAYVRSWPIAWLASHR